MEHIPTIINTIILIVIFWYQKSKNKVLTDRIAEQSSLLRETNDVVNKLSQAIDSQKTVVDTALEYSKAFDVEKIESIIRREIELDYKEKISSMNDNKSIDKPAIVKVVRLTAELVAKDYITPLAIALYKFLYLLKEEERKEILKNIPEDISLLLQDMLAENIEKKSLVINTKNKS